ncbi:Demethylsterigmatocystin 6-O-methyltransferase [Lachnellula arida]|uniref:Demethylsterigmatocystin 6-O-methyltransferase n=1 Tax=Lachnellula arida TaxID=1316785 RepID=A0A8T9BRZ3_9HELO|nr:Demethylsterigmatocystin 6-O-methyltransferase [Lachnellula arida]
MSTIESLLSQLRQAAATADLSVRYHLSKDLQRLATAVATPRQVMQHYCYTYTAQAVARIAVDLKLFAILTQSNTLLKTEDIAGKAGADPTLTDRLLRHLASTYAIDEVGESAFAANDTTRLLASAPGEGNIVWGFDTLNPAIQKLPAFLKDKEYKNPDTTLDTAFHRAFDTNKQFFLWFQEQEELLACFHSHLTAFKSPVLWTSVVPLAEILQGADTNKPIFVDVGGGHGFQCEAFRNAVAKRFPGGRVINQDLPETLSEAPHYDGIEMMAQNFYEEQQIKGARIYYIRQVLHDLNDETAKQVLRRIRDAMSPQSVLLIDELVIPETGASPFSTHLDVTMMSFFSSTERTVPYWQRLLGEVGLQVSQIYRYDPQLEYSILEAIPTKG